MAGVRIDSGPLSATYPFRNVDKNRWQELVRVRESFLKTNIKYDCRCLLEFCQEAELVYADLGYASVADMIRDGYKLNPVDVNIAVEWLKLHDPQEAIGFDAVKQQIAEARANKDKQQGKRNDLLDGISSKLTRGTTNENTLRRLARDAPELLDKIESGELSVNQAAILAGIRKKPTPEEICLKAFAKVERKLDLIDSLIELLDPAERESFR